MPNSNVNLIPITTEISGCNESRTGLPASSSTLPHGHHLYRYSKNYIGYPLTQGSHINCVCLCTVLFIKRHCFI